jgi:hypothetical protein
MRVALTLCSLVLLGLVSGCGSHQEASSPRGPLFAGKLEDGTFWQKPLTSTSPANNEGHEYDKGSRVEVYDQFIVVTTSDGLSHLHPHGYYSGLRIKRD